MATQVNETRLTGVGHLVRTFIDNNIWFTILPCGAILYQWHDRLCFAHLFACRYGHDHDRRHVWLIGEYVDGVHARVSDEGWIEVEWINDVRALTRKEARDECDQGRGDADEVC